MWAKDFILNNRASKFVLGNLEDIMHTERIAAWSAEAIFFFGYVDSKIHAEWIERESSDFGIFPGRFSAESIFTATPMFIFVATNDAAATTIEISRRHSSW